MHTSPGAASGSGSTFSRWFDRAIIAATLMTCAIALSPNGVDPDLWGHVQYGRDWLREGFATTATYTFTAEGYPWINHENIAELVSALGMDGLGPLGMMAAKCLLGVAIMCFMMWRMQRQGLGLITICVSSLLVATNLMYFWALRPQLLSFACYTALLALLSWCFEGWEGRNWFPWLEGRDRRTQDVSPSYTVRRLRHLWLAPLILCVWANSHGGFAAGFFIFTAYLGLRGIEAVVCRGREAWGLLQRFALMIAATGLATLINPYGPGLHHWMLNSLWWPRPEILEWRAPDMLSSLMLPFWLILFTSFASLLLTRRSRDFTHLVIMGLILWQALMHVRHIPFFTLSFAFWMPLHIDSMLRRFQVSSDTAKRDEPMSPVLRYAFGTVLVIALVLLGVRLQKNLRDLPVERKEYPVSAFQYIADQNFTGRMVVTFNWAQYALAAFGPRQGNDGLLVNFDGRYDTCYPWDVVNMSFDFLLFDNEPRFRGQNAGPMDDERILEHGQPDLVLIGRDQPHSVNVMFRNQERWTLLYQDKLAQLWGRSSKYADPASPDFVAAAQRRITDDPQTGTVTWPALPLRTRSVAAR